LDEFLLGLQPENYYNYVDQCINAVVYTMDDYTYLQNNETLRQYYGLGIDQPFMNFTKALSGNFSSSLVYCYQFAMSWYSYQVNEWALFNGDVGNYILSFVFAQAGNAPTF
jgi:hypothetical protein